MIFRNKYKYGLVAFFLWFGISTCLGQGSIQVTKRKLFLNRTVPSDFFRIWNVSDKDMKYIISLKKSNMNERGIYILDTVNPDGLKKHIRFFPRYFTLAPGELQKIRVQVRNWSELEKEDDYIHIYIKEDLSSDSEEDSDTNLAENVGMNLSISVGVGIPLIIQKSNLKESQLSIEELELIEKNKIGLTLGRSGEKSIYCNIRVLYFDSENQEGLQIGALNGISLFSNMEKRKLLITLTQEDISAGRVEVLVTEEDSTSKDAKIYTRKELKL